MDKGGELIVNKINENKLNRPKIAWHKYFFSKPAGNRSSGCGNEVLDIL